MDGTRFWSDLQTLSMISTAVALWDAPFVKKKIRSYFSEQSKNQKSQRNFPDKHWYEITNLVLHHSNYIGLPSTILIQLQKLIVLFGEKIYGWIQYVTQVLNLDLFLAEKIYWSSHGAIDETKIFNMYWRDIISFGNFKTYSKYFEHFLQYSIACRYCCERFLNDHKVEMLEELSKFCPIRTGDEMYCIVSCCVCITLKKSVDNVTKPFNMFQLCIKANFSKAARFYWTRLNAFERFCTLRSFAEFLKLEKSIYVKEKQCEILLFLINQMDEEEKLNFLAVNADRIVKIVLPVWPYQELIVTLVELDWDSSIKMSKLWTLLIFVLNYKKQFIDLECPVENKLCFEIFQKGWGYMSANEKISFVVQECICLFLSCDMDILNLVLNDSVVAVATTVAARSNLNFFQLHNLPVNEHFVVDYAIKIGCWELVKKEKFHVIDDVIEKVLDRNPNPKELLKCAFPQFVMDLIGKDNFSLINKFLDWSSDSDEEKSKLKNEIPYCRVCRILTEVKKDFELADKFLKWQLETDEIVKIFKKAVSDAVIVGFMSQNSGYSKDNSSSCVGMKAENYISCVVYEIWNKMCIVGCSNDFQEVGNMSDAFIKFYYETDDQVENFKKNQIIDLSSEDLPKLLFKNLFRSHGHLFRLVTLDAFFKFCLIPSEKIEKVKIRLRNDFHKLMDKYLIDHFDLGLADFCIRWLYDNPVKGKEEEIMKNYINCSNNGSLLRAAYWKKVEKNGFDRSLGWLLSKWNGLIKGKSLKSDFQEFCHRRWN